VQLLLESVKHDARDGWMNKKEDNNGG